MSSVPFSFEKHQDKHGISVALSLHIAWPEPAAKAQDPFPAILKNRPGYIGQAYLVGQHVWKKDLDDNDKITWILDPLHQTVTRDIAGQLYALNSTRHKWEKVLEVSSRKSAKLIPAQAAEATKVAAIVAQVPSTGLGERFALGQVPAAGLGECFALGEAEPWSAAWFKTNSEMWSEGWFRATKKRKLF